MRNPRLNSKFMTSQIGKQLQNTYCPISQAVKTTRHWKYKMRNIFLEKSFTRCGGETSPRPFLKNQICAYLWINSLRFYTVCFYYPSRGLSKYIESKVKITCFYLVKLFKKTKRRRELTSLPHILHDFWRKVFLNLHSIN